ncbi:uncharacterized mitochondrial protein AtMg00310-like [Cornus florida]|uniref:uncharacterized mitochondrial protein AtMg00310-like n=1 Tax=Cornus florida TaxID=4283 RepID=UPI0028A1C42B|nr:uncharacterized mitochondrial protein AtMg00310-like [Cornus florida]
MSQFWWAGSEERRKTHWITWDKPVELKKCGGLGFHDLEAFNLALLAKLGWRLQVERQGLVYELLKGRYFSFTDFMRASKTHNPSWAWSSILAARGVLEKRLLWKVGNGRVINCWKDCWIPGNISFKLSLWIHDFSVG